MKKATDIHRKAMDLVDRARAEKARGESRQAEESLRDAFEKEREAALLVVKEEESEPTRSVLCRSAASLALQADKIREAERLISLGLAGNPPEEIAEELRDLLEDVYFQRHLQLRGIMLEPNEIQLALAGDSVGFGVTSVPEFTGRVTNMEKLLYRTAERKLGRPYRDRGAPKADLKEKFEVYLTVPRAASFAVTLRLGHAAQMELPGMNWAEDIVDEVVDCFELLSLNDIETLSKKIDSKPYYRNFIGLVRSIAPDGKNVRTVGITTVHKGEERHIALRESPRISIEQTLEALPKTELLPLGAETPEKEEHLQIRGTLLFADGRGGKDEIQIVDENETSHRVSVPEGLMDDIVRPMWKTMVVVTGSRKGQVIMLHDIQQVKE